MAHQIVSKWVNELHFHAKGPGGEIKLDADEFVGGQNLGLRPKALMLISLAGCTGMDVTSLLKKMRIDVNSFSVEVVGELTEEHPKVYQNVKVNYYFNGENIAKDKVAKAVDLSVTRYCGVFEMFRSFTEVEHEIHYI